MFYDLFNNVLTLTVYVAQSYEKLCFYEVWRVLKCDMQACVPAYHILKRLVDEFFKV